jgi:hypothetical protein
MKRKENKQTFWLTLTTINVLALLYPTVSLIRSESGGGQFVAAFVMIGVFSLLAIVDAIAVAIVYSSPY